jgi:hypothetical protein
MTSTDVTPVQCLAPYYIDRVAAYFAGIAYSV